MDGGTIQIIPQDFSNWNKLEGPSPLGCQGWGQQTWAVRVPHTDMYIEEMNEANTRGSRETY